MAKQYLIPGKGYLDELPGTQYLIPGIAYTSAIESLLAIGTANPVTMASAQLALSAWLMVGQADGIGGGAVVGLDGAPGVGVANGRATAVAVGIAANPAAGRADGFCVVLGSGCQLGNAYAEQFGGVNLFIEEVVTCGEHSNSVAGIMVGTCLTRTQANAAITNGVPDFMPLVVMS